MRCMDCGQEMTNTQVRRANCAHHYPRAVPLSWSSRTLPQCQSSLSSAGFAKTHPAVGRFSANDWKNIFTGLKVMTLQLITEVREDGATRLMSYLIRCVCVCVGGTLCNSNTHVHICKIGKRWKQTFPDVHADRMHTTACRVRTCYYAMSRNSDSRQSVGRQQWKAAIITEHSHLSGWCQGPVHVKQAEGIPVRREAVQFFHISILFLYFVCLFVCFSLSLFAGCKRRKWDLNKT